MEETINRKLHNSEGFTLGETLLAVLIMLMVATIVASGIPVARNAYNKVVLASNGEVLLSTTISTLRNELGTASYVNKEDETTITFYSAARSTLSKISLEAIPPELLPDNSGINTIALFRYAQIDEIGKDSGAEYIAMSSSSSNKKDLYVTYESVDSDSEKGIVAFNNLTVYSTSGAELAKRDKLSIRVLSGIESE